jgi:hypothetical protein
MPDCCAWCDEPVLPSDVTIPGQRPPLHYACGIRAVMGSVAHIEKRCGCFVPGSDEHDPPNLPKREAAEKALLAFQRRSPYQ